MTTLRDFIKFNTHGNLTSIGEVLTETCTLPAGWDRVIVNEWPGCGGVACWMTDDGMKTICYVWDWQKSRDGGKTPDGWVRVRVAEPTEKEKEYLRQLDSLTEEAKKAEIQSHCREDRDFWRALDAHIRALGAWETVSTDYFSGDSWDDYDAVAHAECEKRMNFDYEERKQRADSLKEALEERKAVDPALWY